MHKVLFYSFMLLGISACAPGGSGDFTLARACAEAPADLATDSQHGTPARADGPVEVGRDGQGVYARQTVSLSNGFGGASQAEVEFSTINGAVISCAAAQGGYGIRVHLEGRGATEEDARAALASMQVRHEDVLAADVMRLATRVEFGEDVNGVFLPLPVNIGSSGRQRAASIVAALPAAAAYIFRHDATNGPVYASGFRGTAAVLSSVNGGVALDGRWDQASLESTNGPVDVAGDFAALTADSTNGPVYAQLATGRSVDASFNATNSTIEVALAPSASAGFDLRAETTNGSAQIRVRGTEPVGEQAPHAAHHRTPDYDRRAVKIDVSADATNGSVAIHD